MTNGFECPQFQVSQKMWLTESPEDLSAEKPNLSCKSEKFPPFSFPLIFFSCLWQVSRESGFAVPSAWPVDKVTSQRETITPSLSHEGHLQFCIYMVKARALNQFYHCHRRCHHHLQQRLLPSGMWGQSVSMISFENEVWILESKINLCSHAYSQIMRALLWDHP